MTKKPKPRSLSAEPLEERLPVSSTAAGVLFGFGLAQNEPGVERSATPGYEASQTQHTASIVQQPSPIDLTLDLQLDPLAVDLIHAEESLLDTISAPSEDPFVLTPLTPSAALSDTNDDAHRELGDELLLYQISTLEVHQVSFEPMTPHRGFARHDFGDAMTPPEDLTAYGYSPVANELKENGGTNGGGPQMSCGCGPGGGSGCGCTTPYVQSACLTGDHTTACSAPWTAVGLNPYTGYYQYYHPDATMYMFQDSNDTASINAVMSWVGTGIGTITVYAGGMMVAQTQSPSGVNSFSCNFDWEKPEGVPNDAVYRDFTFTFTVSGGNTVALNAHIGYAEVQTRFAGYGGFQSVHVKNDLNKSDQSSANTVIVGQHVEAKFVHDPTFNLNSTNFTWMIPSGGGLVKDYITKNLKPGDVGYDSVNTSNNCLGKIITHDAGDLKKLQFDYYYTNKTSNVGVIFCTGFILTDPHGDWHFLSASASFYIEAAECTSFTSSWASWSQWGHNADATGVRKSTDGKAETAISLGGIEKINGVERKSLGITWQAGVMAPIYGNGQIGLRQLVTPSITLDYRNIYTPSEQKQSDVPVLDTLLTFGDTTIPAKSGAVIGGPTNPANDSPYHELNSLFSNVSIVASFQTYVVYKPSGTSIWVTLAMMSWTWTAEASFDSTNGWTGSGLTTGPTTYRPYHVLPVWKENYLDLKPKKI